MRETVVFLVFPLVVAAVLLDPTIYATVSGRLAAARPRPAADHAARQDSDAASAARRVRAYTAELAARRAELEDELARLSRRVARENLRPYEEGALLPPASRISRSGPGGP